MSNLIEYSVSRKVYFSAAHHLEDYDGKCARVHGHNFVVEGFLYVQHKVRNFDPAFLRRNSGMILDFGILKNWLGEIVDNLDHVDLNSEAPFCEFEYYGDKYTQINPTAENLAMHICMKLTEMAKNYFKDKEDITLTSVHVDVQETENNKAGVTLPCC